MVALAAALALVIAAGLGLHLLSTLAGGDDLRLVRDFVRERTAGLTALAHGFSWLGRSVVLAPLAIASAVVATALRRRADGLALVLGIVGSLIIQNVDKAIVARPRPPVVHLERVSGTSFPSGHATEAAAFWLVALLVTRRGRWSQAVKRAATVLASVIIVGVALSRVYLGVHYLTDVVSGGLLGATWAVVIAATLRHGEPAREEV